MANPLRANLNEKPCPVNEQMFGELRQASTPDATEIAKTLPSDQRARLATFCYNKRHLHALGLLIASTCDRDDLVDAGGNTGELIFEQSRNAEKVLSAERMPPGSRPAKPISLARSAG